MPEVWQAKLVEKLELKKDVFLLSYQVDREFTFSPGQFVIFDIAGVKRAYSVFDAYFKLVRFLVDTSPKGVASRYFDSCAVGDVLSFSGPFGNFTLSESERDKIFVATGTGLAPVFPMVKKCVSKGFLNLKLFWGIRYKADDYSEKVFGDLIGKFDLFVCLSRESVLEDGLLKGKKFFHGYVTDALAANDGIDFFESEFYICGRKEVVESVLGVLKEKSARFLFYENF